MIRKITLWTCFLFFLVFVTTALFQYQLGGEALEQKIASVSESAFIFRGLVFIGVFGYWELLFNWVAKTQSWTEEQLIFALKSRWRIAIYMALVELLIIQNMIGKVISYIEGQ